HLHSATSHARPLRIRIALHVGPACAAQLGFARIRSPSAVTARIVLQEDRKIGRVRAQNRYGACAPLGRCVATSSSAARAPERCGAPILALPIFRSSCEKIWVHTAPSKAAGGKLGDAPPEGRIFALLLNEQVAAEHGLREGDDEGVGADAGAAGAHGAVE